MKFVISWPVILRFVINGYFIVNIKLNMVHSQMMIRTHIDPIQSELNIGGKVLISSPVWRLLIINPFTVEIWHSIHIIYSLNNILMPLSLKMFQRTCFLLFCKLSVILFDDIFWHFLLPFFVLFFFLFSILLFFIIWISQLIYIFCLKLLIFAFI